MASYTFFKRKIHFLWLTLRIFINALSGFSLETVLHLLLYMTESIRHLCNGCYERKLLNVLVKNKAKTDLGWLHIFEICTKSFSRFTNIFAAVISKIQHFVYLQNFSVELETVLF